MKPLSYSLIAAALACGLASAQTTAYTTPVGYVSLGDAGSIPAETDMTVAIPLDRAAAYAGTVLSVAGNVVTLSGSPAFTIDQYAGATPYVVKIENNAASGLVALISSNTADTLTVAFQNNDTLAGVIAGDKVSIRPAWTIASFIAPTTVPPACEFGVWEGISAGTDLAPEKVYYSFNGHWRDQEDDSLADDVIIYPNEGFRLRNAGLTPVTNLVVSGEVPTANSRVFVDGNTIEQDSHISYFSPVPELVKNANIAAGNLDQLFVYDVTATGLDNAPQLSYYYLNGIWRDQNDDSDVSDTLYLQPGQMFVYRALANRADTILSDVPAYVPSL